jgi:hypothetical protein
MSSNTDRSPSGSTGTPTPSFTDSAGHDPLLDTLREVIDGTSVPLPGTAPSLTLTGEYNRSDGGNTSTNTSTGGLSTAPKVKVICMSKEKIDKLCCGVIGTKSSFCLKAKKKCSSHNKSGAHFHSKFLPKLDSYYVCKSAAADSAWFKYTVSKEDIAKNISLIDPDLSVSRTLEDWKILFEAFKQADTDTPRNIMEKVLTCMKSPADMKKLLVTPMKYELMKFNISQNEDIKPAIDDIEEEGAFTIFEMSKLQRDTFLRTQQFLPR